MATNPDDLAHQQERAVGRAADARFKKFFSALESARRDLQGIIAEPDTFTAQKVLSLTSQIDSIQRQLNARIKAIGSSSPELAELAKVNLESMLAEVAPTFRGNIAIGILNTDVLYEFSNNELAHVTGLTDAQLGTVRLVLFSKVGVQGQSPVQVAKFLAGADGVFAKQYGHIENIVRTETSTVYNAQSLNGIKYANKTYDLALNKRIVETIDVKRNHPISEVLNGQVQEQDKPFRASVAAVAAKARALHKTVQKDGTVGGIFWPVKGGFYVGDRLPAHFRERGIMVPTQQEVNVPD